MRSFIKKISFSFLYQICVWKRINSNRLLVLTYHRISDAPDLEDSLKVSLGNFENQMRFIKKNYRLISGDELSDIIRNKKPFPKNSCLITFDDGWNDNYTNAFPVLKKLGIPAVIFVSTDFIGTNQVFWHEQLVRMFEENGSVFDIKKRNGVLNEYPEVLSAKIVKIIETPVLARRPLIEELISYLKGFDPGKIEKLIQKLQLLLDIREEEQQPVVLTWEQIKEMSQHNICFGSHTKSHAILTNVNMNQIREEITESKRIIEDQLGKPVDFIAYPNGNYSESIVKVTEEAGYLAGFTCVPGMNYSTEKPFELKRRQIMEDFSLGATGKFSEGALRTELSGIRNDLRAWIKKEN